MDQTGIQTKTNTVLKQCKDPDMGIGTLLQVPVRYETGFRKSSLSNKFINLKDS